MNIMECYNTGNISANALAGGIVANVGRNSEIKKCYNTGIIDGKTQAGGICQGMTRGVIENCYNTGNINSRQAGGLCAYLGSGDVGNCYNAVFVGPNASAVVGGYRDDKKKLKNYYLSNCGTEIANIYVSNSLNDIRVTEDELRNLAQVLGEDFTEDVENINNGYPILKWQLRN